MNALTGAYMATVTAAVLVGASLNRLLGRWPGAARHATAFSAGVMLAVCLLYLIPDALAFQHGISVPRPGAPDHASLGYALSLGFLSLLTIERSLLRVHEHGPVATGAHSCQAHHEPPHHHQHDALRTARELGIAWSTVLALCLHGLFDGVALYAAGVMPAMGPALAVAVILHKVSESATLLTVLQRGGVPWPRREMALLVYAAATPLGMLAAARLLRLLSEQGVSLLMAFVAGSLLHLVTGHLLPEATEHGGSGSRSGAFVVLLGGFFLLVVARLLGAG
ncbi:MAG: ZIP family metal transporter [Myxococcales bacterium]|nr:ZIP family metal transporter [Myxococcota bacterium]MDW8281804.1 ZIP family metal transporter [Myxococcales bacterium]